MQELMESRDNDSDVMNIDNILHQGHRQYTESMNRMATRGRSDLFQPVASPRRSAITKQTLKEPKQNVGQASPGSLTGKSPDTNLATKVSDSEVKRISRELEKDTPPKKVITPPPVQKPVMPPTLPPKVQPPV